MDPERLKRLIRIPSEIEATRDKLRKRNRKMLVTCIGMAIFNILIFTLFADNPLGPFQRFRLSLLGSFIGTPFWGFLLAFAISKIEYKGLSYWQKYMASAVLSIFLLTGGQFLLSVICVGLLIVR